MKTILFTTCYLNEDDRFDRNKKFLDYYFENQTSLGFDEVWLVDNASNLDLLEKLGANVYDPTFNKIADGTNPKLHVVRFEKFLPRNSVWDYPYCWRGMWFVPNVIKYTKCNKVLLNDTDFFILTPKMAEYVRNLNTGWEAFWCEKYRFPETALNVLCEDSYHVFEKWTSEDWIKYNGKVTMELVAPFTKINKDFNGDRWGEASLPQTKVMDFYGQCPVAVAMKFNM